MHSIRRRLRPSLMVGFAALFVALGGTAVAQSGILIDSPSQIAPRVVRLQHQSQPTFAAGVNKGLGQLGAPFLVNATNETESVAKLPAGAPSSNAFLVRFNENVAHCQWSATAADFAGQATGHFATAGPDKFDRKAAVVRTYRIGSTGSEAGKVLPEPHNFYLLGRC